MELTESPINWMIVYLNCHAPLDDIQIDEEEIFKLPCKGDGVMDYYCIGCPFAVVVKE